MIRRIACVACMLFVIISAVKAVAPFPAYFSLPPAVSVVDPNRNVDEKYGVAIGGFVSWYSFTVQPPAVSAWRIGSHTFALEVVLIGKGHQRLAG
jgi:hypothetical protein